MSQVEKKPEGCPSYGINFDFSGKDKNCYICKWKKGCKTKTEKYMNMSVKSRKPRAPSITKQDIQDLTNEVRELIKLIKG